VKAWAAGSEGRPLSAEAMRTVADAINATTSAAGFLVEMFMMICLVIGGCAGSTSRSAPARTNTLG